jgi:hypothetical protein
MKKRKLFSVMACVLGLWLFTGCIPGSTDTPLDDEEEPAQTGYAPESPLPSRYTFATGTGNQATDALFFQTSTSTQGWQASSIVSGSTTRPLTGYTYKKTGANTADFTCTATQSINGPIRSRIFEWSGELTYSSATKCTYQYQRKYHADGVAQETTNGTYTFYIYINP